MEVTILYYTSNREDETFEKNIMAQTKFNANGLPIVSVSQKPIDMGKNICVGERPHSYTSEFMQIRLGLEAITTPYVLTAESDFLYPFDYFNFTPTKLGKVYRFWNVWIAYDKFHFKGYSDGAQLVDRKLWLDLINKCLPSRTDWNQEMIGHCQPDRSHDYQDHPWTSDLPAISFKTGKNINSKTQLKKDIEATKTLPFWGEINSLKNQLYESDTQK
jgi:hypothetical protein